MQYPPPPRRRSAGPLVVIVLLFGFLFLGLIMIAGAGAFVLTKTRFAQARAVAERQMAERAARARAQAEQRLGQAQHELAKALAGRPPAEMPEPGTQPIVVSSREITVKLDAEGNVQADGKSVDLEQLKALLQSASTGRETALSVTVSPDAQCRFEHVAAVLDICQEVKVATVRIATRDP